MRRRDLLAGLGGLAAGATVPGTASGDRRPRERAAPPSTGFDELEPLGSLAHDGLAEAVVGDSGTVVFGAVRDGFVAIDASDPGEPSVLARETAVVGDGGGVENVFDVALDGDRLVVAGPASGSRGGFGVFDVGDPANPERVAGRRTDHAIHNADVAGDVVYCTGTGAVREPLVVYELDGGEPRERARWSVGSVGDYGRMPGTVRSCHDVTVVDGRAYVAYWDAGTWILDVSDPGEPEPVGSVGGVPPLGGPHDARELPGNSHYARPRPDGTVLAVGKESWDREETDLDGGPGGVDLWTLPGGDPTGAERVATLAPPEGEGLGPAHNFGWRGDRLYVAWYDGGVRVYDASDPANPQVLGGWTAPETASFWTAKPAGEGFVASSFADPGGSPQEQFDGVGAALYTFPEPSGEGRPARTMDPRPTTTPAATPTRTATRTRTRTPTEAPTDDRTATGRATGGRTTGSTGATAEPADTATETTTGGQAGFGALAALAGGAVAAWWRRNGD